MNGGVEGIGRVDDEVQVSAADQAEAAERKKDQDADWLSMTTGDPAHYLKDLE